MDKATPRTQMNTCGLQNPIGVPLAVSQREVPTMNNPIIDQPRTGPNIEHREGTIARSIEQQTAKVPSDVFLWAALSSMAGSLVLKITGSDKTANFVGQWAPTFLILGLYNKMVKLHGSEAQ